MEAFWSLLLAMLAVAAAQDAPVFEPLFSSAGVRTVVPERSPEGTTVLNVRARGTGDRAIRYGIDLPSGTEGVFSIDPLTGNLTVGANGTARLVIRDHNPTVFVFDAFAYYLQSGPSGNRTYLRVTVEVLDVNDPPRFAQDNIAIGTLEGTQIGTIIARFVAVDDDLSSNGILVYSLSQSSPPGAASFSIHPLTGDLMVIQTLNLNTIYEILVTATDEGIPPLSNVVSVTVRVDPTPPVFQQFVYTASVDEFSGEEPVYLTMVVATDSTPSSPAPIVYSLASSTPFNDNLQFSIGRSSGNLTVNGTVDRETFSRYFVTVSAYEDRHGVFGTAQATVVVHINDVNEPPEFLSSHYTTVVSEGAGVGDLLFNGIIAFDLDQGTNSELSYSISSVEGLQTEDGVRISVPTSFFAIDAATAVLTVNTSLEREAAVDGFHYYEISVVATDGGSPALSSDTLVTVVVLDINDNPPQFNSSSLNLTIPENEPFGSIIRDFIVVDNDQGLAASLMFMVLGDEADRFGVEIVSVSRSSTVQAQPPIVTRARLISRVSFDREEIKTYQLRIMAMDLSDRPLNASIPVTVTVADKNDNQPTFSINSQTFNIPENTQATLVTDLAAVDSDSGSNGDLTFSLESSVENLFTLLETGPFSVQVLLNHMLDRENTDSYSFRVFATDGGSPALVGETVININVLDINDNFPVFDMPFYPVNVAENTQPGAVLVTVRANDMDIGTNGQVRYFVTTDNPLVEVDNVTGEIVLIASPDYELIQALSVEVLAYDLGIPRRESRVPVTITISDENDNDPIFENAQYSGVIAESAEVGNQVIRVVATDADSGSFGEITYTILMGNEAGNFGINNATGSITVERMLDVETMPTEYMLTVEAMDGAAIPRSSIVNVSIEVQDVNDNSPEFINEPYAAVIIEVINNTAGNFVYTVSALDIDSGNNSVVRYSLAGRGSQSFVIDSETGEVRVSDIGVDFETIPENPLQLNVIAADLGFPQQISIAITNITVIDGNDNAPVFFGAPYSAELAEGTIGARRLILNVNASDVDSGINGVVMYSLAGGGSAGNFEIDSVTGSIFLNAGVVLDRESNEVPHDQDGRATFTFGVTAIDGGTPSLQSYTMVTILVADVNDNSPVFSMESYVLELSESLPVGTPIINLVATDEDFGTNGQVNYAVASQSSGANNNNFTIAIDAVTGVVTLARPLDRERLPAFSVVITATDQGLGSNTDSVTLTINVTDVNDNHPIFNIPPGGYQASVSEDAFVGDLVITVEATDLDSSNQFITYSIDTNVTSVSVPFAILDPTVGRITVAGPLDREAVSEYQVIVVARDRATVGSQLETIARVTVNITDVNDNIPQFSSDSYTTSFPEDVPSGTVLLVTPTIVATDADTTPFFYSLEGPGFENFYFDPDFGFITTQELFDFETTSTFDLLLIATDLEGLTSNATFMVTLIDVNDNSPTFDPMVLDLTIPESAEFGSELTVVSANDLDSAENSFVTYTLNSADIDRAFTIDSVTGVISVNRELDFEARQSYTLVVTATDGGTPQRNGTLTINLNVLDENDNPPIINNPLPEFVIVENIPVGMLVGQLTATDADSGVNAQLVFEIVNGNEANRFVIDGASGRITTNGTIDREEQGIYLLTVEVRDSSAFPRVAQALVTVTVTDLNDNSPTFTDAEVSRSLPESIAPQTLVAFLSAVDPDDGSFGQLTYAITSQLPEPHFYINSSTGTLFTNTTLDYELITSYQIFITATDGGTPQLMGSSTITINVVDENDNNPIFSASTYRQSVGENSREGSVIEILQATDADSTSNAELVFSLLEGTDVFQVDNSSGIVTVLNSSLLDYEVQRSFSLLVEVRDMGVPPRAAQALLVVTLIDENDNIPTFLPFPTSIEVREDISSGTTVLIVGATDADDGTNGNINYELFDENLEGIATFGIMEDGTITLTGTLDYEAVTMYNFTVEASDDGNPMLTSSISVTIDVVDVNDNAPMFLVDFSQGITLSEDTQPGSLVVQLDATDEDSGENGEFTFRIVNQASNPDFFLDINTGMLQTVRPLDRETTALYTLSLEVRDNGLPPQSSLQELRITITDVNDNAPVFTQTPEFTIREDQIPNINFGTIQATDADVGTNSRIYYHVTSGTGADAIGVSTSGLVSLMRNVDYENVNERLLQVTLSALNTQKPPTSPCSQIPTCSFTTLTINVEDVNDNVPIFSMPSYEFTINDSAQARLPVGEPVNATDRDSGDFGAVRYSLRQQRAKFSIAPDTGIISLVSTYNETADSKYNLLTVFARDNPTGTPSNTANVTVQVYFINTNDLVIITVTQTEDEVRTLLDPITRSLRNVGGINVNIYDIEGIVERVPNPNASPQKRQDVILVSKTLIRVYGLNHTAQSVLPANTVLNILRMNMDTTIGNILDVESIEPPPTESPEPTGIDPFILLILYIVVGVLGGIIILILFLICCVCICRKVRSKGRFEPDSKKQRDVPVSSGTLTFSDGQGHHARSGSWMNAYKNEWTDEEKGIPLKERSGKRTLGEPVELKSNKPTGFKMSENEAEEVMIEVMPDTYSLSQQSLERQTKGDKAPLVAKQQAKLPEKRKTAPAPPPYPGQPKKYSQTRPLPAKKEDDMRVKAQVDMTAEDEESEDEEEEEEEEEEETEEEEESGSEEEGSEEEEEEEEEEEGSEEEEEEEDEEDEEEEEEESEGSDAGFEIPGGDDDDANALLF